MSLTKSIAVFGGFSVSRSRDRAYYTQQSFFEYLRNLSSYFDELTLYAFIDSEHSGYTGRLSDISCRVIVLKPGMLNRWRLYARSLALRRYAYLWIHFPNALTIFPILPFIFFARANKVAIYIGNEYIQFSKNSNYSKSFLLSSLCVFVHEWAVKKSDIVIVRGEQICQAVRQLREDVHVTSPISSFSSVVEEPEVASFLNLKFLYLGQLLWAKGLKYLLRSFSVVAAEYPDASLTIVGSGADAKAIKAYATEIGLSG